ncbi:hypothetical protein BDZ89DRAFT_1007886 [Hymenopellis radicata]|nr:hypothetical protein BDZ89DRAFT_1007886 [Hymenopellis radicata]
MPHHRYPTAVARPRALYYRVSDDVLISILEYLDPASLWNACKASQALTRIRRLVRDVSILRYRFELGLFGLKDGPLSHRRMPLSRRAHILTLYKHHWNMREPSKELTLTFNMPVVIGVAGRFIYEIQNHGVFNLLNLFELPSPRLIVAPTQPVPHQCPNIEQVSIDQVQNLLMSIHAYTNSVNKQIALKVHFRDIRTKGGHPQAFAPEYDVSTQVTGQLVKIESTICGSRAIITIEFVGGKVQHLLLDWHTFQARWLKDMHLHFLDERTLLGTNKGPDGIPFIAVYDLQDVMRMAIKAQFLLPAEWSTQKVEFARSSSPKWDTRIPSNALFSVAPEWNMLVLTAKSTPQGSGQKWYCVPESFFRFLPRKKTAPVLWKEWNHICRRIMNVTNHTFVVYGPFTMGSRVVYVDYHDKTPRLCTMDLSSFHPLEDSIDTAKGQLDERHRKIGDFPETRRPISSRVEDVKVTEDNIVLILVSVGLICMPS